MIRSARRSILLVGAVAAAMAVALLVAASPAQAATFTVNSTNDPGDGVCNAAECTLREAINAANANGESDAIAFASGLSGEIELTSAQGQFVIQNDTAAEDLTINGPGADQLAIDGNDQTRAFAIQSGAKATIEGLTVKNGKNVAAAFSREGGGGIRNFGTLTLTDFTVSDNSVTTLPPGDLCFIGGEAVASGGGIYNVGTLTLTDSTISGNSASTPRHCAEAVYAYGGGIYNDGTLTVTNSTVSGNSATASGAAFEEAYGGGIATRSGSSLTVTNSTISGNSASSNDWSEGGGISSLGTAIMSNTIVAGNNSVAYAPDAEGTFNSQGYNLIGDTEGNSGWVSSDKLNVDPKLGPLQDNGGPTKTHALLEGSPAINYIPQGTNGCGTTVTTDQRGVQRPQGETCDIGAFELEQEPPNNAPVATNDSYRVKEDAILRVDAPGVLANDSDPDGDSLRAAVLSGPSHGSLTLNPNGSFTYTPAPNYNGPDSFTYTVSDDQGAEDTARVAITVRAVNDAPTARANSYATREDVTLRVDAPGVLANDSDQEGDRLSASVASGPRHGRLTLRANGSLVYEPQANFNGTDSFSYKACDDGASERCDTAKVTITVRPVAEPPQPDPKPDPPECTIKGTSGRDALQGTDRRDVICGFGGDDTIQGMGGNDLILGGGGDDSIQGGKGDDTLKGQDGNDTLQGQEGNDKLYGGKGRDALQGGEGRDVTQQ